MSHTDNELSRRRFLQATGGAATAAALAGCLDDDVEVDEDDDTDPIGDDDDDTDPTGDDDDGTEETDDEEQVLRLINGTMDTMDPVEYTLANAGEVIGHVFDGPLWNPHGALTVEPMLAEDYEIADDNVTYTLHLREGVTYHEAGGQDWGEVTAQDFVYNWERLAGGEHTRRASTILDDLGVAHETETVTDDEGDETEEYVPWSLAVEALDDYTLELELSSPNHAALDELASFRLCPLPEGIVGDVEGYDGDIDHDEIRDEIVVGCGPFKFESWASDQEAEVSAYDDYWGEGPHIDGIHWQIMEDSNAIFNHSMNMDVDVPQIPTEQFDPDLVDLDEPDEDGREVGTYGPMRNDETVNYQRIPGLSTGFFGFNTQNVEKAARQAVAHALDHEQIANDIFRGRAIPGYTMTPPAGFPGGPEAHEEFVEEHYPYGPGSDIDAAQEVMEEAGYSEDDPYEFSFTITDSATNQQMANLLRDMLAAAHIDMEIEVAPFATMIDQRGRGNIDSFNSGWNMGGDDPANILQLLYPPHTQVEVSGSIIEVDWFDTDAADRAADGWDQLTDNPEPTDEAAEARAEAVKEMELAMWEDLPFVVYEYRIFERFAYEWVDAADIGPAGMARHNYTRLNERP